MMHHWFVVHLRGRRNRNNSSLNLRHLKLFGSHHHHHEPYRATRFVFIKSPSQSSCLAALFLILCQLSFSLLQNSSYLDQSYGEETDFDFFDKPYSNKPQNISVRPTGANTISIHWQPPYESVQGYKIKFRLKGSKKQETIAVNSSYHYYELKNLEKGTGYQVKVAAIFANETGPYSEWYNVETLHKDLDETQVPERPSSLRAKPDGNSIHLTWMPPKNRNIVVRGYTIGWGEGLPDRYTQVIEGDQRFYTIDNVSVSSEYVISLRANNLMGEGEPIYETVKISLNSDKDGHSLMLPPIGLKARVISSSAIVLDWTDTNHDPFNPDNRWYLVRHTSGIHSASPRYRYLNTTKLSCLIEDLKPNTQYEFSVKVIKNKRNSTWSMSVLNTTQEAVPSTPPRDLTVVSTDDDPTIINLHWQPPKQPNGQIIGYVIFYTQDNTQEDRDWIVKVIFGDKLNAVLNELQPSSVYYFKIQARNNKGYGPLSSEVSFRTLPAPLKTQTSSNTNISISLFALIVFIIALLVVIFLTAILKIYFKNNTSKNLKNRKGYIPTATSPGGKNTNSRLNNAKDLKPPDLWIHHNEQVEMKLMDKNGDNESSGGGGLGRNNENSFAKIKKTNSTYGVNSALYDDINKSPSSSVDNMGMATMRRSSSIRPKATSCVDHSILSGMINMEPSTGLSRPLYPKTNQFNLAHMDSIDSSNIAFQGTNLHLYDPVSVSAAHIALTNLHENNIANMHPGMNSLNNSSYMSSGNSSSPHSVISNNTVLTNSSTGTNITNSSTSPPNTSIYLSNNRPKPGHSALKSFGVPTPPPPLPSLATLGSMQNNTHNSIYNSTLSSMASPSKKFLLTTTNNLNNSTICGGSNSTLASNCKSATNFSDDNSVSASFNPDDLHQEMANLDNLVKDLNAMKPNHGMESC